MPPLRRLSVLIWCRFPIQCSNLTMGEFHPFILSPFFIFVYFETLWKPKHLPLAQV